MISISPSERLIAEVEGAIGWMIVNNPTKRNAMSLDMFHAIGEIVDHFEKDPAVRVIVLKGAGDKAFMAGADISQFEKHRSNEEQVAEYDRIATQSRAKLEHCRKPTIAMIHGYAIGGGVGVALDCDLRIADETARFGIPAARLGVGYRFNGVKKLVDVVGPAYAKEIFFTARQFTAAEALQMGLVNRVVPEGELDAYVRDYCKRIAENAPLTIEASKGTIDEIVKTGPQVDRARCDELVARCFASQDFIEGRRAFMEKRKAEFTGK